MKNNTEGRSRVLPFFVIYCVTMIILLFGRDRINFDIPYIEQLKNNINLIPFKTVNQYFGLIGDGYIVLNSFINLIGNIAVFIPLGIFLPAIKPRLDRFVRFITVCTAIILSVEILQFFTLLGSFDVDDLVLNLLGSSLGFLIYKTIKKRKQL